MNKTEKIYLVRPEEKQYKVNMHTHTTVSDGSFTPEEIKKVYMEMGYSAVAFTDHQDCRPHTELTDAHFVALTGVELDFSKKDKNGLLEKAVHINAIYPDPQKVQIHDNYPLDYVLMNKMIAEMKQENAFVTLNHPVWSDMSSEDILKVKGFDAMEVSNSAATMIYGYSEDFPMYEGYLRAGGKAIPVAGDDCHRKWEDGTGSVEYGKSFVMAQAKELSYQGILDALNAGNSYASTGLTFQEVFLEGDLLHIVCSPCCGVYVRSKLLNTRTEAVSKTDSITEVTLNIGQIRKYSPYFLVALQDTKGRKAWLNPCWFDRLS